MLSLVIFGIVVLYLVARTRHVQRLDAELSQPIRLPESEGELTKYLTNYAKATRVRKLHLEPLGVGVVTGYQAYEALAAIDPHGIAAANFAFPNVDLDNVGEAAGWFQGLDGVLKNRLAGYTAEQVVAVKLAAEGHVVEFPDLANQAGYDLLVDGEPLQVKLTLDGSPIDEHLSRYPDIPVITNAEMVALDTIGVGMGGYGGAKLGAAIGSAGGPAGVAIGSVIGGVVGAIAGKMAGNAVKVRALKQAKEQFEQAMVDVGKAFVDACETGIDSVDRQRTRLHEAAPRTLLSWLWPRRSDLIRDRIDAKLKQRRNLLRDYVRSTKMLLKGKEPHEAGRFAIETLQHQPIPSARLRAAINEAVRALNQVQVEMKRLGINPHPDGAA